MIERQFLKERLVIFGRGDLFGEANLQDKDVAIVEVRYTLKRIKGDSVERFGGARIKELYKIVIPLDNSRLACG